MAKKKFIDLTQEKWGFADGSVCILESPVDLVGVFKDGKRQPVKCEVRLGGFEVYIDLQPYQIEQYEIRGVVVF